MIHFNDTTAPLESVLAGLIEAGTDHDAAIQIVATAKFARIEKGKKGAGQFTFGPKTPFEPHENDEAAQVLEKARDIAQGTGEAALRATGSYSTPTSQDLLKKWQQHAAHSRVVAADAVSDSTRPQAAAEAEVLRSPHPAVIVKGNVYSLEGGPRSIKAYPHNNGGWQVNLNAHGKTITVFIRRTAKLAALAAKKIYLHYQDHVDNVSHQTLDLGKLEKPLVSAIKKSAFGYTGEHQDYVDDKQGYSGLDHEQYLSHHAAQREESRRRYKFAIPIGSDIPRSIVDATGPLTGVQADSIPGGDGIRVRTPNNRVKNEILAQLPASLHNLPLYYPRDEDTKRPLHFMPNQNIPPAITVEHGRIIAKHGGRYDYRGGYLNGVSFPTQQHLADAMHEVNELVTYHRWTNGGQQGGWTGGGVP